MNDNERIDMGTARHYSTEEIVGRLILAIVIVVIVIGSLL